MHLRMIDDAATAQARGRYLEAADLLERAAALMGSHPRRRHVLKLAQSARNRARLAFIKSSKLHLPPQLENWNVCGATAH